MATITPLPAPGGEQKIHGVKIDMTPMVDLGFLLITFFIFTATLSQPQETKLIMPRDGEPTVVPQSKSLTLLLDRDKVFAYEGLWDDALHHQKLVTTNYSVQTGIGSCIRQKQKTLPSVDDITVLIKPLTTASYQNVVAALDEMQINGVTNFMLMEASTEEKAWLQTH